MTDMTAQMPLNRRSSLTKTTQVIAKIRRAITWLFPGKSPKLSDHIARDIGLSRHDIELMRHQWPSQDPKNPRL